MVPNLAACGGGERINQLGRRRPLDAIGLTIVGSIWVVGWVDHPTWAISVAHGFEFASAR